MNNDCLPILMPLYIMLAYLMLFAALSNADVYIMLAYLMLFAALSNAICLHNDLFAIDF